MATYKVKAPDGTILTLQGPEGADKAVIMQKAKELYARAQSEPVEDRGIPIRPRKPGGPMDAAEKRPEVGSGLIEYNEEEEATIKAVAGGDAQKEHFLRLIPTIEWRANADGMRSKRLSKAGAAGPYQFMAGTAKSFGVRNRFDFADSAAGAGKYYDEINQRYNGNMAAMLADYNGGPTQAKKVLAGEEPVAETAEYIKLADKYGKNRFVQDTSRREVSAGPTQHDAPPEPVEVYKKSIEFDPLSRRGKVAVGAVDAAATAITGIAGQAAGGLIGLTAIPFVGMEGASNVVKAVSDVMTWSPKSDYGKAFYEAITPFAETVDEKVKDSSMALGRGNPAVATIIETTGNAILMLAGPGSVKAGIKAGLAEAAARGGGVKGAARGTVAGAKAFGAETAIGKARTAEKARADQQAHINKISAELQSNAKALGIELRRDRIHDSVRRVAEGRAASERGEGFGMISQEANKAKLIEKRKVNKEWDDFRATDHYTNVGWAGGLADNLTKQLSTDGFRVFESKVITDALDDLRGLNTRTVTELNAKGDGYWTPPPTSLIHRQKLKEVQAIRERLIKAAKDNKDTTDGAAIAKIGAKLDEMLDQQFLADAAKGRAAPWEAWKKAQDSYSAYKNNWNEFKAVRDMVADPDMTPQKLANTLLGTSAMLGGPQASRLYDHIMQLTGNSPKVKIAVQATVMYDLVKPLLDTPQPKAGNYRAVANNIRRFRKENPELIKAMGLPEKDLVTLQHAARAAEHTTKGEDFKPIDIAIAGINRHLVGHEIAQAGFRVRLAEKIINKVLHRDATSHRDMLKEFAGITEEPLSSAIAKEQLVKVMIRGELASQYQNIGEWGDTE